MRIRLIEWLAVAGLLLSLAHPTAGSPYLYGIDVSEYQLTINWDNVKAAKDFAIIKASERANYRDPQFTRNQAEARRVGILRGYYHFARPAWDGATAEADWFLSVVGTIQTGEILMLDYEDNTYSDAGNWAGEFCERIYSKTGIKPIVYTYPWVATHFTWTRVVNDGDALNLANYDGIADPTVGTSGTPWPYAINKQYSETGSAAGLSPVDLDVFNGDANKWMALGPAGPLPTITTQPQPQTICSGSGATFTVAATISSGTLSYQWRFNSQNIEAATSPSYTATAAGSYDCVVTGPWGSVTTSAATLTVNSKPSITTQPRTQALPFGSQATFTVVASGPSLSYQWRRNKANISGAISPSYSTGNPGSYDCVVTDCCGSTTSSSASLVINNATWVETVAAAKQLADGTVVGLSLGPAVTRSFGNLFYIEDSNRAAGIEVIPSASDTLAENSVATIYGSLATIDGERILTGGLVNNVGTGDAISMIAMTCSSAMQPLAQGLFVRMCGVASVAAGSTDSFELSDGSASAITVKLYGAAAPPDGAYINVRGTLGQEATGCVLRVNKSTDIW